MRSMDSNSKRAHSEDVTNLYGSYSFYAYHDHVHTCTHTCTHTHTHTHIFYIYFGISCTFPMYLGVICRIFGK